MNWLQSLLENYNLPILTAFILGLMTAISPCPLATNITALGFISKEIENRKLIFINGLIYTLGRALSYTLLGVILYFGASKFHVARFFQYNGERFLGPLLVIIGVLMLDIIKIKIPGVNNALHKLLGNGKSGSSWTALFMGIIFALAFCPYSGVLYFGMLIPMTISSANGLYLPFVFAIATGLPVIILAWIIGFSISNIGNLYHKINVFQKWFNKIVAILFIAVGIYYITMFYFK
jgi:cytochrome c-type biogenesis protein